MKQAEGGVQLAELAVETGVTTSSSETMPKFLNRSTRRFASADRATRPPPSPVENSLVAWKLNAETSP